MSKGDKDDIQTTSDALDLLKRMVEELKITDCRVGLAGSFAKNDQKRCSDLDIVLDIGVGYDILSLEYAIQDYIRKNTHRDYDIIYINALLRDKNELLGYSDTEESSEETFYDSIIKNVIWIE